MTDGMCAVDGCTAPAGRPGGARGWCRRHYRRWNKYGDPLIILNMRGSAPDLCTVDACDKPPIARGWCQHHYDTWRFHGDPLFPVRIFGDHERRFWSKVNKEGPVPDYAPRLGRCWIWTGQINPDGYGWFGLAGKNELVHRYVYEMLVGPIPEGLEIDHLCMVRPCLNPPHLEAVTHAENTRRRWVAERARKSAAR